MIRELRIQRSVLIRTGIQLAIHRGELGMYRWRKDCGKQRAGHPGRQKAGERHFDRAEAGIRVFVMILLFGLRNDRGVSTGYSGATAASLPVNAPSPARGSRGHGP